MLTQIEEKQGEANEIPFLFKSQYTSWLAEICLIYDVFYLVIASYPT